MSAVSSVRVPGGYRLLVDATLRQCLDACLMTSYCLAADYDFRSRDCHVHGSASYCRDVIAQRDVTHYKRVPCTRAAAGASESVYTLQPPVQPVLQPVLQPVVQPVVQPVLQPVVQPVG